ncbi:MAG: cytochrome b N-terminal domain-containing protein [Desulfobulbaceae bacterium]|jgi:ubiquinol-cytochrome c reductase cytochrome b subunit|nr:cytochrome b N-terminal domain-containing protein [Desulfobulbaceae bacterium]
MAAEQMGPGERLRALPWGAMALISLYVSVASGIIVALQYQPGNAYQSVVMLDQLVAHGAFVRSLHFYASQAFFLLLIAHFLATTPRFVEMDRAEYLRLTTVLPVTILLLFTGYVLRADNTGASAGRIAESIILAIPFIGKSCNSLFMAISSHGLGRIFLHHLVTLNVLLLLLAWRHLHRYRVGTGDYLWLAALLAMFSAFVPAPLDPDRLGTVSITGPWFFLGIQEALRYLPTLVAGIGLPAGFFIALAFLPQYPRAVSRFVFCWLAVWLAIYGALSLVAVWR